MPKRTREERNTFKAVDQMPAISELFVETKDKDLVWLLDVPGLGVLLIRTSSNTVDATGKGVNEGMASFTNAEIGRF